MGSLINKMCKSIHINLLRFLAKLTKKKKDSNFSSLARMFYMHKHRTQYSILNFLLNLLKKKKKISPFSFLSSQHIQPPLHHNQPPLLQTPKNVMQLTNSNHQNIAVAASTHKTHQSSHKINVLNTVSEPVLICQLERNISVTAYLGVQFSAYLGVH